MNLLKKHGNSENGLTLLEVLISITILGILLSVFMRFFLQAGTFTNLNEKKTVGINVARNALMYMEHQSFLQLRYDYQDVLNGNAKAENKGLSLEICGSQYQYFDASASIPLNCHPININDLNYNVSIYSGQLPQEKQNFYIPLRVEVEWKIHGKTYNTEVNGTVKSEDLR